MDCDRVVSVDPEPSVLQRGSLHFYIYSTSAWINGPVASILLNCGKLSGTGKQRSQRVRVCVCVIAGVCLRRKCFSRMSVNVDLLCHCLLSVATSTTEL